MPILLSHNSALERLRSVPPQVDRFSVNDEPLALAPFARMEPALDEMGLRSLGLMQRPVHRLVPSGCHAGTVGSSCARRCHLAELPAGMVRRLSEEVWCAGPELTFVQMAGVTSLLGMVVLGHELCGRYSHFSQMVSGFYERPPLTSVERLRQALCLLPAVRGAEAARRALRWVRDGSASPMETVVSCMLNLPTSMGGFGLVAPSLNYEVELDEAEARLAGTRRPKIDTAYQQAKVGVEFDGKEYHRDAEHDRRRREALAHKGWTIYVLNVDELTHYAALREKVALLDAVPRRRGTGEPDEAVARELLHRLLAATRCGVGLNAALFGAPVPKGMVRAHL